MPYKFDGGRPEPRDKALKSERIYSLKLTSAVESTMLCAETILSSGSKRGRPPWVGTAALHTWPEKQLPKISAGPRVKLINTPITIN